MSDTKERYEYLCQFISESRKEKFERNVFERTRYITLVVEDIYQAHNASAVLRSVECMGIQDVHVIENRNKYTPNPDVVMGADKWLSIHRYNGHENNTIACIRELKKQGYRIVATTPHTSDCLIKDLPIETGKIALVFGTEIDGISELVKQEADEFVKIPMVGFTESYNISVSAAICLYELTKRMKKSDVIWRLSETEQEQLKLDWVRASIQRPDLLEKEFEAKQ
jgi:tRNA (guanosine-2'-O-)-methyltransferase